jgi:tetratricopeptide (TPR) repeat protein
MSTHLENEHTFDDSFFQNNLPQYYRAILRDFRKITHGFVSFNLLFLALFASELFLFFFFLRFLSQSAAIAFALGGIFLTCFSYLVLLFYYQAKKPEQLTAIKDQFLKSCRQVLPIPPGEAQHHLSIAEALSKLAHYLQDFESNFYKVPRVLKPFSHSISRFSSYCYGEDVLKMKLQLLQTAVEEHLQQIRSTPTDLEVHASLANTYVSLSKLYRSVMQKKNLEFMQEKFHSTGKLAIEEFRILSHYAPNDPWVHEQLAAGYKALGMPEDEIREMENLLKLRPQDRETLFRLGKLYFTQGQNAKGLQVYEELKRANFKRAEELLSSYGSYS